MRDRIACWLRRSRHFVTTNALGAAETFAVGNVVDQDGKCWKVTKHPAPSAPVEDA